MANVYDFTCKTITGEEKALKDFQGKVLLVVNTASKCGFTPQYDGLEELYKRYQSQGLEILGFPCNQFRSQEPGTESDIQQFCSLNFGVTFPLFAKVDVNGPQTAPVYTYLKSGARGFLGSRAIKWNFTKFLVNRQGTVIKRFATATKPEAMAASIEQELAKHA